MKRKLVKHFECDDFIVLVDKDNPEDYSEAIWKNKANQPNIRDILSEANITRAYNETMRINNAK